MNNHDSELVLDLLALKKSVATFYYHSIEYLTFVNDFVIEISCSVFRTHIYRERPAGPFVSRFGRRTAKMALLNS